MKKITNLIVLAVLIIFGFSHAVFGAVLPNERTIENLKALTKLYGYVRFFHPSDESGRVDWDKFVVFAVEKVKNAKNKKELKEILNDLFLPIAPTMQLYDTGQSPPEPKIYNPEDTSGLQLVAWQHFGVDLGIKNYIYKSVRLNRVTIPEKMANPVYYELKNLGSKGKEFRLSAYVRADVKGKASGGYLYVSVWDSGRKIMHEDFMRDRPIRENSWKKYEILGKFKDDAAYLDIGAELVGIGKLFIDKVGFSIKNDEGEWEDMPVENSDFEEVDSKGEPENWKTYSMGLYHYMITDKDKYSGKKSLLIKSEDWYLPGCLFAGYPKVGEMIREKINRELECRIPLALWSDENGTTGAGPSHSMETLLESLKKIEPGKMTAENEFVRIGNIIIYWNIIQHFYPYFDVVDVDWNAELDHFLTDVLANKNEQDFIDTLKRAVAKTEDGHGAVFYRPKTQNGGLPLGIGWIENQLVITASISPLFKKGDIIKSIDGTPGENVLKKAEEFVSGSPQLRRLRALNQLGSGPIDSIAQIELIRDGKIIKIDYKRETEMRGFFFNKIAEFDFPGIKLLEDNIYYINLQAADKAEYKELLDKVANAKGVIFDWRWNGKYNRNVKKIRATIDIIPHLSDVEVSSANWNIPRIIYPDGKDMKFYLSHWPVIPTPPRFKGKVVFINLPSVVSHGETIMGIIEHYKLADMVGDFTAGCNGNYNNINLPGGFRVWFTGMKVLKHDNSQHHLAGIKPTRCVKRTIAAVKEGRDEYLEEAIALIKENKK